MEDQKKILIAEDETDNLRLYLEFFKDKDYKILRAADGRQALDMATSDHPDLIIMDWNMPEMSGIEATRRLQEMGLTEDIPIIMATGIMVTSYNLETALEAGAYDFIRKPFDKTELKARINSALKLSASFKQVKSLMKREQELMKAELDKRERELSVNTSFKYHLTENVQRIEKDLDRVHALSSDPVKQVIKEIKKRLNSFSDTEKTWDEFKIHFENVNRGFFDRLNEQFPNLTLLDQRICAYVKMGLGNREIAQINYVETDSVKRSISRLRKKLDLESGMTLRDFIADF